MTTHLLIVQVLSKYTNTTNNGDNMKKLISITILIMLCVLCTACQSNEIVESTTTHTLPPTEESVAIEPEWAPVDCDIALIDSNENTVVAAQDFETFAVIGTDDNAYITIKVSDTAAQTLTSISSQELSLTINGEYISKVSIDASTFAGEIELGHDLDYNSLCELATTIRGLF